MQGPQIGISTWHSELETLSLGAREAAAWGLIGHRSDCGRRELRSLATLPHFTLSVAGAREHSDHGRVRDAAGPMSETCVPEGSSYPRRSCRGLHQHRDPRVGDAARAMLHRDLRVTLIDA